MTPIEQALRELVSLKDLKDAAQALPGEPDGFGVRHIPGAKAQEMMAEYERRKPAAWKNARAALPAPADQVLVPKRLTRAMLEVLDEEGWTWEDLLAAAEAITEAEYADISAARKPKPRKRPHARGKDHP